MNRRTFLGAAAALSAFGSADEIVDAHVHFYDPFRDGGVPWPRPSEKILYRRAMPADYQALSKARVIVIEASPLFSDNQWILDLAAGNNLVAGCVGHLDPSDRAFAAHVAHFRENPKFLGVRLSTGAAEKNFAALGPLEAAGLTLDLIGGEEIYPLAARLSDRYPALRIILDHLPLPAPGDRGIGELAGRKQVYAKVSWILRSGDDTLSRHVEALDRVWSVFGEDRVVYGSNWPVCDLVVPYSKVQETAIEYFRKKPLQQYLLANSRACYRWGK